MKHEDNQLLVKSAGRLLLGAAIALVSGVNAAHAAQIAFAWANNPTASSYVADGNYAHGAGDGVTINRTAKGRYTVELGDLADVGANLQVSAYGAEAGHCNIMRWAGGKANVMCIDGAGQTADRRFTIMAIKRGADDQGKLSYAWLHDGDDPAYTAMPNYAYGDGTMAVTRTGVGAYRVNLGAPANPEAAVLVTAYNSRALCNVVSWGGGDVRIRCKGWTGAPVDTAISVLAVSKDLGGVSFAWNQSNDGAHAPQYSHASNGVAQSVTRTGEGRYTVALGPEANAKGHVQAVAYGSDANCGVASWSNSRAYVRCAKGADPADTRFVVAAFKPKPTLTLVPSVIAGIPAVEEDCVSFSPARADLKKIGDDWRIVDGDHYMFNFDDAHTEGALALNIIKRYDANKSCFVGRPNASLTYILNDGDGPTGATPGEDCVQWNLDGVAAKYVNGKWRLVDGQHWIAVFPNEAEARQSLNIVKKYGFTKRCYVGRPNPNFAYLRK